METLDSNSTSIKTHSFFKKLPHLAPLVFVLFFYIVFTPISSAATLSIAPASGQYKIGDKVSVAVKVNTEGVAINAVDGVLSFNPSALEILSVSKSSSIVSIWVQEPQYSQAGGTASFSGVILNPGYTGKNGTVLIATFRVKSDGGNISFSSGSVLANDGYGTNVLRTMSGSTFSLTGQPKSTVEPTKTPTTIPVANTIQVTSSTHPDQNKWYANNNPEFQWSLPSDTKEILLVLGTKSTSIPTISYVPPISTKKLDNVADGTWYFNGKIKTSTTSDLAFSYKFNIDVTPPHNFEIARIDNDDPTNPQPKLSTSTSDDTSGLSTYEIKMDNSDGLSFNADSIGKIYTLPIQFPGKHSILVKAIDNAGNIAIASSSFEVVSIEVPIIKSSPAKLKPNETLRVIGTAKSGYTVRLYSINKDNKNKSLASVINVDNTNVPTNTEVELQKDSIQVAETRADQVGNWSIDVPSTKTGSYLIYTRAIDGRGAISSPSNMRALIVYKPGLESILNFLNKSWQVVLDFAANKWFWILLVLFGILVIIFLIKDVFPWLSLEFQKIRYISNEYQLHKELGAKTKKTLLELKLLTEDIKKELGLLKKIEQHRHLHSDEKYLKDKLQQYLNLVKMFK